MPNSLEELWPRNSSPNAPIFVPKQYILEETNFAGILIGGVLYGMPTYTPVYSCSPNPLDPVSRGNC